MVGTIGTGFRKELGRPPCRRDHPNWAGDEMVVRVLGWRGSGTSPSRASGSADGPWHPFGKTIRRSAQTNAYS